MEIIGLCQICGKTSVLHTCILCGSNVCIDCFDIEHGVCINCKTGVK